MSRILIVAFSLTVLVSTIVLSRAQDQSLSSGHKEAHKSLTVNGKSKQQVTGLSDDFAVT